MIAKPSSVPFLLYALAVAGCHDSGAARMPAAGDTASPSAERPAEDTAASHAAQAPAGKAADAADAALARLHAALADGRYDGRIAADCLAYVVEDATPAHVDVAINEKHGGACPGDPSTAPIVDRYRVTPASILRYDPVEGDYVVDGDAAR